MFSDQFGAETREYCIVQSAEKRSDGHELRLRVGSFQTDISVKVVATLVS